MNSERKLQFVLNV